MKERLRTQKFRKRHPSGARADSQTCFQVEEIDQHEGEVQPRHGKRILPLRPLPVLLVQQPLKVPLQKAEVKVSQ